MKKMQQRLQELTKKELIETFIQYEKEVGKNYKELYKRQETLIKKPQNKKEFQKWKNK